MNIIFVFVLAGLVGCGSGGPGAPAAAPVHNVANDDVRWDGTDIGVVPQIVRSDSIDVLDAPDCSAPLLVEALLDPERYVVAHVLLTGLLGETWSGNGGVWNGLRVQIDTNGRTTFEGNDQRKLHEVWLHKLTSGSLTTACSRRRAARSALKSTERTPAAADAER